MNERIQELMVKSSSGACYDGNTPALYGHKPVNEIEEFAKLIVRECIRLCDEVDLAGADDCIDKIKDHFGIAE